MLIRMELMKDTVINDTINDNIINKNGKKDNIINEHHEKESRKFGADIVSPKTSNIELFEYLRNCITILYQL